MPSFCNTCRKRGHDKSLWKDTEVINKITDVTHNTNIEIQQGKQTNPDFQKQKTNKENTKDWVSRVFYTKVKKPVWRIKRVSKQIGEKIIGEAVSMAKGEVPMTNVQKEICNPTKETYNASKEISTSKINITEPQLINGQVKILRRGEQLQHVEVHGGRTGGSTSEVPAEILSIPVISETNESEKELSGNVLDETCNVLNETYKTLVIYKEKSITEMCAQRTSLTDNEDNSGIICAHTDIADNSGTVHRSNSLGDLTKLTLIHVNGENKDEKDKGKNGRKNNEKVTGGDRRVTRASSQKINHLND